jgi:5'-3' exoribonuclease 1
MGKYDLPVLGSNGFYKGLMPDVKLGAKALPGFPTLDTIEYTACLGYHGVNVFQTESPNESMIVTIKNQYENKTIEQVARSLISSNVYIGWPYLTEAKVIYVQDREFRYQLEKNQHRTDVVLTPLTPHLQDKYYHSSSKAESLYSKRYGVILGQADIMVNVHPFKGIL